MPRKIKSQNYFLFSILILIFLEVLLLISFRNYFLSFGSIFLHLLVYGLLVGRIQTKTNKYVALLTLYIAFLIIRIITFKLEFIWLVSHVVYLLFIFLLITFWLKDKPSFNLKINWKSRYRFQWFFLTVFVVFMIFYTVFSLKELDREYDLLENNIKVEATITNLNIVYKRKISVDYEYSIDSKKYKREGVIISRFVNGQKQVGDTLMVKVAMEDNKVSRIPFEHRDDWKDIIH